MWGAPHRESAPRSPVAQPLELWELTNVKLHTRARLLHDGRVHTRYARLRATNEILEKLCRLC